MKSAVVMIALVCLVGCPDEQKTPAPPPTPPPAATKASLSVDEINGTVEIGRGSRWRPAAVGDALAEQDEVRTSPGGTATLLVGDQARVIVREESAVAVREITETVASLKLNRGRIGGEVRNDKFKLRIEPKNSDATAEASQGEFAVYTDGAGLVAVAASTGKVKITSKGGDTILEAGQQVVVTGEKAAEVQTIPKSAFLKVAWPESKETSSKKVTVRGKVQVGSAVSVNGEKAAVSPDGTFVAQVRLRDGKNPIQVEAVDVLGRETARTTQVTGRHRAPTMKVDDDDLWE